MINVARLDDYGEITNVSVWDEPPDIENLIPIPDGLPVGIGHYYKNDRFETAEGEEIVTPDPIPPPEYPVFVTQEEYLDTLEAVAGLYEENLTLQESNLITMEAVADVYELILGGM